MNVSGYSTVTELPQSGATKEQLSMLYTRYRIARDLAEGKDVLEVACGPGIGLGYLASKARRVIGGDYDSNLVSIAKDHYGDRCELHQLDAQSLPFENGRFDAVLLLEAIYYLPHPERFVAEARRVLRDNGVLYICSANREWPGFNASPFSFKYYSAFEFRQLLGKAGFESEVLAGFPVTEPGIKSRILNLVRRIAVRLKLVPKTMSGKEIIKRLLHGKLYPLPRELSEGVGEFHPPVPVDGRQAVSDYKVLYIIGRPSSKRSIDS